MTAQPFDTSGEGRSLDYSLGTENAPSFPKLSAIAEDTPVLGIVRSSNSDQPINYLHLRLAKKPGASGGRTYRLIQAPPESRLTFNFDASKPLGQLSMMLIVGGQWSERDKRVHFTSRVAPIEVADGQRQVKGLDVPYLTGWIDLKAEREGDDYIVMRQDASIKLRPQGLLLDIKIDNDSGGNPAYLEPYRNLVMYSFTIRSNAYGGSGSYALDESALRNQTNYQPTWLFDGAPQDYKPTADNLLTTACELAKPLDLPYHRANRTQIDVARNHWTYRDSPHVLLWVMPTGASADLIKNGEQVRTQFFAHVEDDRVGKVPTVYTTDPHVDAEEAKGKIVVPKMTALPVYASKKLAVKHGQDIAFPQGAAYHMTLHVNRFAMPAELISQYEVNADGTGFVDDRYENVAYIHRDIHDDEDKFKGLVKFTPISYNKEWGENDGKAIWANMSFKSGTFLFAISHGSSEGRLVTSNPGATSVIADQGNYYAEGRNTIRCAMFASYHPADPLTGRGPIFYCVAGYPSYSGDGDEDFNIGKTGTRLHFIRYEVEVMPSRLKRMKVTSRFVGMASLEFGYIPRGTQREKYKDIGMAELRAMMSDRAKMEAYWNDPLRQADDVVRYFPFLGERDPKTDALSRWNEVCELPIGVGYTDISEGGVAYYEQAWLRESYPRYDQGKMKLPFRLWRSTLSMHK